MTEPESDKERRLRTLRELEGKNISHYSVMLSAYISSRTDANKAIFAFSSAAIGLLLTSFEKPVSHVFAINTLYSLSVFVLVVAVISTLFIHIANAKAIESYIRNEKDEKHDFVLKTCSYINYIAFGLGILFASSIAVVKIYA